MKFNFDKLKEYKMYHILMPVCLAVCKTKMKVQYIGKENVPKEGGFILACNHSSNFDPIALGGSNVRPIHFMSKSELFKNPFSAWFLTHLNAFPIRRGHNDKTAIDYAERLIKNGWVLGIFPEGTRNHDGKPGKPKAGAALIAKVTHADVLPCSIYSDNNYKSGTLLTVRFGKVIKNEEFGFTDSDSHEEVTKASEKIMDEITALWEEENCKE